MPSKTDRKTFKDRLKGRPKSTRVVDVRNKRQSAFTRPNEIYSTDKGKPLGKAVLAAHAYEKLKKDLKRQQKKKKGTK